MLIEKKKQHAQIIAALPPEQTYCSRRFENTGVDFTGLFDIRNFKGRSYPIFVWFSTKAIHLEPLSELSTQLFLQLLRGFPPDEDVLAKSLQTMVPVLMKQLKFLKKVLIKSSNDSISKFFNHQNLSRNFIAAGAPHMGGIWETGMKCFKFHFRLYSRPLSPMSENTSDHLALRPGHFLIGFLILIPAEPHLNDDLISLQNRWHKMKALSHYICEGWKDENLKELHKRYKWKFPSRDLSVDGLVVVRQKNVPSTEWRLGRVLKVYPGADQRNRVADIIITRPLAKLIIFP